MNDTTRCEFRGTEDLTALLGAEVMLFFKSRRKPRLTSHYDRDSFLGSMTANLIIVKTSVLNRHQQRLQ